MSLEEMMKAGSAAAFDQYKDGELWYRNTYGFAYPEPMTYRGEAAFQAQEHSLQLMR